jgi:predicted nucleic acid-binding protein
MPAKAFLDSHVLIYAVAQEDPRGTRAEELLRMGGILSVQVLNEFTSVARRKIRMPWAEVREALAAVRVLCATPIPITAQTHETALRIAEQYGYGIYDALIAAAALEAGCVTLYSEDFQEGQIIDGQLTIRNPFKDSGNSLVDSVLTHPIQKLVPGSRKRQKPRPPVVQPQRRPRERDSHKWILRLVPGH